MLVEKTEKNQVVITVSSSDSFGIQRLINYANYLESTKKSTVKQSEVDKLADEVNQNWWNENKKRFIK